MFLSGATVVTAVKVSGILASSYGVWWAYSTMPETETRRRLMQAFRAGALGLKRSRGRGKDKKEFVIYPKIQSVKVSAEKREIVFTIPMGLNPDEVYNHDWLLQQAFGENIEVKGGATKFVLDVYPGPLAQYKYDFPEIKKALEELERKENGPGKMYLPIFVGKSRQGFVFYDMAVFPHLLEAGETGSGKSVALRSILTTLLLLRRDSFDLYCGDLKRSEFHFFRGIAKEVVTERKKMKPMLDTIHKALFDRFALCEREGVEGIIDLPPEIRPKFIVLAIDEVVLIKDEEHLMKIIDEIGALGRAMGIFLILAMQRPDREVVEGRLKSNMTVRMAFRHADEINSRITIGSGDAADIKNSESGLFIFKLDGITRIQAPYLKREPCRALLATLIPKDDTIQPPHKGGRKKASEQPRDVEEMQAAYEKELQEVDEENDDIIETEDFEE